MRSAGQSENRTMRQIINPLALDPPDVETWVETLFTPTTLNPRALAGTAHVLLR